MSMATSDTVECADAGVTSSEFAIAVTIGIANLNPY